MAIQGQKVRITCLLGYDDKVGTVEGKVKYGSDNRKSLLLEFEAILDGGFVGSMPVLQDDDGVYRNLFTNHEVGIEWL